MASSSINPGIPTGIPSSFSGLTGLNLNNTLGSLLIGTFLGILLYGWFAHQAYRYFRTYPKDPLWLKTLVGSVLVLEGFNNVICTHFCYNYLVTNYLNPFGLFTVSWSLKVMPFSTAFDIFVCQLFFIRRVWLLGHKTRVLCFVIGAIQLSSIGFAIYAMVLGFRDQAFSDLPGSAWVNTALTVTETAADILVALSLTWALHANRTGLKSTDSLIDTLILYTVTTGVLTSIFNIVSLIFSVVDKGNFIYVAVDIVTLRLYANTMLATINMRQSIASNLPGTVSLGVSDVRYNHGTGVSEKPPTVTGPRPVNADFVWDQETGRRSRNSIVEGDTTSRNESV